MNDVRTPGAMLSRSNSKGKSSRRLLPRKHDVDYRADILSRWDPIGLGGCILDRESMAPGDKLAASAN